jgi:hypothetical protein
VKVFTCNDHVGVWLFGVSVIVATDEAEAQSLLCNALIAAGLMLEQTPFALTELDTGTARAVILWDGDY